MRRAIALVILLAGCNRVFGLRETELIDGGDSVPPDSLPANCRAADYQVDKDTYLLDATPHGLEDAVRVDSTHPGLFRFAISYQPGEYIAAAVMHMAVVAKADACAAACGACPVDQATKFRAYWNNSSWSDNDATSTNRRATSAWDGELATGSTDRSAQIVQAALTSSPGVVDLALHMVDIAPSLRATSADWIRYDSASVPPQYQITVQLLTDAPIAFASDDRDTSTCQDPISPASVTLTLCTPAL
ncbi:MAG TPA: hypothetical protein VLB44_01265 [Kofleriaceae bacterium]|nr:hypothetical protein [Kofleriaceae bacterium]